MRLPTFLLALLVAVGVGAPATAPAAPIDDAASDYVHLVLEIGAHEKGYIDAYFGPPEWRTQAEAHPRAVGELKAAADHLHAALEGMDPGALQQLELRRRAWLLANVASARFRLDMIEGARAPFQDEAERLFLLRPKLRPLESYDPVIERIAALVPGEGALNERIEAFRNRYIIPKDRLTAVMDAAIAECRRRTLVHLKLPANERFRMEFVTHQSWSAYNWYEGDNQSLIQVNTDLPIFVERALGLGCHEGYPGHHVQGIYNERQFRERGWIEFSVAPLYAPSSPLNEGGGNYGIDLAFPGGERVTFEKAMLYPLAGLDPQSAAALDGLRKAFIELAGARLTIAAMYLDGKIDRSTALELSQRYQLTTRARAEQGLAFTEQYRSYIVNYGPGEDLVRDYVESSGDSEAARWAAYERILSEPTLPTDLKR